MDQPSRKPMLTPAEPASDAGFRGAPVHRLPKPRVAGSNPVARSTNPQAYQGDSHFPSVSRSLRKRPSTA
jgi:hypothetical protein